MCTPSSSAPKPIAPAAPIGANPRRHPRASAASAADVTVISPTSARVDRTPRAPGTCPYATWAAPRAASSTRDGRIGYSYTTTSGGGFSARTAAGPISIPSSSL